MPGAPAVRHRSPTRFPNQKRGYVPHHLPGTNADVERVSGQSAACRRKPLLAGAETTYPEYMLKLRGRPYQAPATAAPPAPFPAPGKDGEIEVLPVQGNVYMLAGAGGNIAIQVGEDGVLVVDTGSGRVQRESHGGDPEAIGQTDTLHRQYQCRSGPYRRQ